ncbi:hypothetical protein F385_1796 [Pantoea agglomerans 299R]|nr:hypothetical protein F385_1796 [Pantoea agglomerans 299R]
MKTCSTVARPETAPELTVVESYPITIFVLNDMLTQPLYGLRTEAAAGFIEMKTDS